jgi:hypothetical protein
MLMGLFRPVIILPDREYADAQLRAILLHELTHLRRRDVLVKWLSVVACAVHWFNPIVWLARREIDRACELACDEAVIRGLDASGKQCYGETLLYVAADSKTPWTVLSATMCEEKRDLKERLAAIARNKQYSRAAVAASAAVIIAAILAVGWLGAGSRPNQRELQALSAVDLYFAERMPNATIAQRRYYPRYDSVWVSYTDENGAWTKNAVLERMGSYCAVIALNAVPEDPNAPPAPLYDPNLVFENRLEVSTAPDNYTPSMSSYPGIYLHVGGQAAGGAITIYECESGAFATLENSRITTLGDRVQRAFGAAPSVHWSPAADTKNGDKIKIRLELDGQAEDSVTLAVVKSEETFFYSLVPANPDGFSRP